MFSRKDTGTTEETTLPNTTSARYIRAQQDFYSFVNESAIRKDLHLQICNLKMQILHYSQIFQCTEGLKNPVDSEFYPFIPCP